MAVDRISGSIQRKKHWKHTMGIFTGIKKINVGNGKEFICRTSHQKICLKTRFERMMKFLSWQRCPLPNFWFTNGREASCFLGTFVKSCLSHNICCPCQHAWRLRNHGIRNPMVGTVIFFPSIRSRLQMSDNNSLLFPISHESGFLLV